jgi:hypothetical protein
MSGFHTTTNQAVSYKAVFTEQAASKIAGRRHHVFAGRHCPTNNLDHKDSSVQQGHLKVKPPIYGTKLTQQGRLKLKPLIYGARTRGNFQCRAQPMFLSVRWRPGCCRGSIRCAAPVMDLAGHLQSSAGDSMEVPGCTSRAGHLGEGIRNKLGGDQIIVA